MIILQPFPVWSDYGEWGDCDKTCGGGNRTKSVTCMRTDPDTGVVATFSPEEDCGEKPEDQAEECGTDPCIQGKVICCNGASTFCPTVIISKNESICADISRQPCRLISRAFRTRNTAL